MGMLNKFGSNAGALVETTIVNAVQVPAGQIADITDWGATARAGTADSIFMLQKSNNGIAYTEVDRIELPTGGTVLKTLDTPIKVNGGQWVRGRFSQSVAGTVSMTWVGETNGQDIVDI